MRACAVRGPILSNRSKNSHFDAVVVVVNAAAAGVLAVVCCSLEEGSSRLPVWITCPTFRLLWI